MKASKVKGKSKEVGAKVMYQGREMTVSKGVDSDGDLKMHDDLSGFIALTKAIQSNTVLRDLEYAHACIAWQLICDSTTCCLCMAEKCPPSAFTFLMTGFIIVRSRGQMLAFWWPLS